MESIRGFSFFFKKTKTSNPLDLEVTQLLNAKSEGFEVLVFLQKTKTSNGLKKVLKLVLQYLIKHQNDRKYEKITDWAPKLS